METLNMCTFIYQFDFPMLENIITIAFFTPT